MPEPHEIAKAARASLSQALQSLQGGDDLPEELFEIAEPVAKAMGLLHGIERSKGAKLDGSREALDLVRGALDKLQTVESGHPAVDQALEAIASSLAKLFTLSRAKPVAAAGQPAAAPPKTAPAVAATAPVEPRAPAVAVTVVAAPAPAPAAPAAARAVTARHATSTAPAPAVAPAPAAPAPTPAAAAPAQAPAAPSPAAVFAEPIQPLPVVAVGAPASARPEPAEAPIPAVRRPAAPALNLEPARAQVAQVTEVAQVATTTPLAAVDPRALARTDPAPQPFGGAPAHSAPAHQPFGGAPTRSDPAHQPFGGAPSLVAAATIPAQQPAAQPFPLPQDTFRSAPRTGPGLFDAPLAREDGPTTVQLPADVQRTRAEPSAVRPAEPAPHFGHEVPPPPAAAPAPAATRPQPTPSGAPRVPVELGAHSPSNFYKGLSGNDVIEHGGIFVATYRLPKVGTPVALRMHLPGDLEFDADGIVQWTREVASGDADPGFGARFTRISAEGRQLVYRYTRNREPMFYDDL